jgi:transcriptional regulator with XRE-family HTH domain
MTLTGVLEAERVRQGQSLNGLAKAAGQSPGRVHSVLSGQTANPSFDTVRAILAGLGRSLTWLDRQLRDPIGGS